MGFYWWEGIISFWLVGWFVCGCFFLYINIWWLDVLLLYFCMYRYFEGEFDLFVSVIFGKLWFVIDRYLML